MQELIDTVAEVYETTNGIKTTAMELSLPLGKVKKLLITGNVLPYTKVIYKMPEISQNAERVKTYKAGKASVDILMAAPTEGHLWDCIVAFQNYSFHTASG